MNWRGFQIKTALIVFLLIISAGLGLHFIYQKTQVLSPLAEKLNELPGVLAAQVDKARAWDSSATRVKLSLSGQQPLALTLPEMQRILEGAPGSFVVELEDRRDHQLTDLLLKIQFAAEEAISTGEFCLLQARAEAWAAAAEVQCEIGLDRQYIYLRLSKGENYLQKVISRDEQRGKILISGWGGVGHG